MKHSDLPWRCETCDGHWRYDEPVTSVKSYDGETVCDNENYYPNWVHPNDQKLIAMMSQFFYSLMCRRSEGRPLWDESTEHHFRHILETIEAMPEKEVA